MAVVGYTDGGCRGNPGPGAWAFVLIDPATRRALARADGEAGTTNNRMEMMAAIMALKAMRHPTTELILHTDSRYLVDCCTTWLAGWKRRGWRRKDGPLKNVDLLQELDGLLQGRPVRWVWVKGHAGNHGNEFVDALLNQAMDRLQAGTDPATRREFTWDGPLPA